jgi:hypothetical protein
MSGGESFGKKILLDMFIKLIWLNILLKFCYALLIYNRAIILEQFQKHAFIIIRFKSPPALVHLQISFETILFSIPYLQWLTTPFGQYRAFGIFLTPATPPYSPTPR